jgi:hypothetical protein|tara:strand:+ start:339 stop:557 length:219 start_codon:yes stop_codon:yes gene_type:complete
MKENIIIGLLILIIILQLWGTEKFKKAIKAGLAETIVFAVQLIFVLASVLLGIYFVLMPIFDYIIIPWMKTW